MNPDTWIMLSMFAGLALFPVLIRSGSSNTPTHHDRQEP